MSDPIYGEYVPPEISVTVEGQEITVYVVEGIAGEDGEVQGPASSTDNGIVLFDSTSGKIIKDSGKVISTDGDLSGDSDNNVPTEKAVKAYVDGQEEYTTVLAFFDGGGAAIEVGEECFIQLGFAGAIEEVSLLGDQSGSIQIDIWKDAYANYPPTDADSICASAVPAISSGTKYTDSTLTGWTKNISAGDILLFHVDSCTTIEQCQVALKIKKS